MFVAGAGDGDAAAWVFAEPGGLLRQGVFRIVRDNRGPFIEEHVHNAFAAQGGSWGEACGMAVDRWRQGAGGAAC